MAGLEDKKKGTLGKRAFFLHALLSRISY